MSLPTGSHRLVALLATTLGFALLGADTAGADSHADASTPSASSETSTSESGPAPARDWEFELSPYLWLGMIDGRVETDRYGVRHIEADAGDVLKAFDMGFMMNASARWRRFLFFTDFSWTALSDRDGIGETQIRYELEQEIAWFEALAGYRVYERRGGLMGGESAADDPRAFIVDAFAGVTYTSIDNKLDLRRDPLLQIPPQERTIRERDDWAAPYLALRLRNDFTHRIGAETFVGVGGFGAGAAPDIAWQASANLYYSLNQHMRLSAGYRGQGLEKRSIELALHGPVIGLAMRY